MRLNKKIWVILMALIILLVTIWLIVWTVIFSEIEREDFLNSLDSKLYSVTHKGNEELKRELFRIEDESRCVSKGGVWKQSMRDCAIPVSDVGRKCFSSFQCDSGVCGTSDTGPWFFPVSGNCIDDPGGRFDYTSQVYFGIRGMYIRLLDNTM